jgi:diguanylate cyclase (GGDEF)-like protein
MNPANNLPAVSGIVKMPVVIQNSEGEVLFTSPGLKMGDASLLPIDYQLHDDQGHLAFRITGYENVEALVAEMNQTQVNLLLGFVVITGIAMLAALWMFSRFLFRPVDTMMRDIARCTQGDLTATVGGRALKEFAALADAFNLMTEKVNSSIEELQRLSALDGLTGLANRRQFDTVLAREWRRACRNNLDLSVILIDLDYFKLYNDTYGHLAGDDCLQAVARAFSLVVHRPGDLVARYGGEEFVIILPETPAKGALTVANKIQREVARLKLKHSASEVSDIVTISIGITSYPPKNEDGNPSILVAAADTALYRAKAAGRNRVEIQRSENIQADC